MLIEVYDPYEGIVHDTEADNLQSGYLRGCGLMQDHLTASAGYEIKRMLEYKTVLEGMIGKLVYWQEYADAGGKFPIDGKQYVIMPFYRLIGIEE